jgi:3-oxoacyl-[acyl-carrier-protein] synthase II
MTDDDDVWITGVGAATPLGTAIEPIAASLLEGRSAVRPVVGFSVADHPSQIAAQMREIPRPDGWNRDEFSRRSALMQLVLWCSIAALRDAGWWERRSEIRLGIVLGLGGEWTWNWEAESLGYSPGGAPPEARESLIAVVARELGLSGPTLVLSAACASSNHALAQARRWLRRGWADVCLAGACDMGVTPISLASFGNLRALSRRNAEPSAASRPFDRGRDGFVIGEGGALFVLETSSRARARGARVYASVRGCGASSDAHHPVIPSPDLEPAIAAMRQALADAQVESDAVDYVNAHATGTALGDAIEAKALRTVLGETTRRVPVSSTKSMTGHLLTASGSMECLACLIAMQHAALPPTINLDDPDPECDLFHVRGEAIPRRVDVAVSNSFGFGGSNTCLVLKAV